MRRGGHRLDAGASVAVAGRGARGRGAFVRQGQQRGGVRLRLELGGVRATAWGSAITRRSSWPCPSRPPRGTACWWRRGEDRALATRLLAGAARRVVRALRASGVHVLFPRDEGNEAERMGGERLPAPRRLSVSLVSPRSDDLRRVPGALQLQAAKPDQARAARRARARNHGETLPPEGHTRELARTMHALLRVDHRASTACGAGMYLNEALLRGRGRALPRPAGLGGGARRSQRASRWRARSTSCQGAAPVRPLLGRPRGRALPALRRLLLRGHPALHRARHRRLRAGRRGASTSAHAGSSRR